MKIAPAGVRLGRAGVRVVGGQLDPRRRRRVRLGDADGEDRDPGAVLAVRRLEDEALAVRALLAAGRRPAAVVADPGPGLPRRSREVLLHLRPRREVRGPVHQARHQRAVRRARRRGGCSSRSARRPGCRARRARTAWSRTGAAGRTASGGTSRPAPGRRRSRRGRSRAAPGRTRPGSPRARCRRRRPGSRPVGTVGRARDRRAVSAPPPVRVPQAARLRLEHPVHQRRVVEEGALDRRPGEDERHAARATRRCRRRAARRGGSRPPRRSRRGRASPAAGRR